eukprot:Tbor_TRINITY_DN3726_c0_g2::TRINITY_DN3726_c0_g2_i1::g.2450::m.2450/K15429/TRM5, TRMT5; tRNA (guanine37-N1)-methyltransferase
MSVTNVTNSSLVGDPSYRAKFDETFMCPALRLFSRETAGVVIPLLHGSLYIKRGVKSCRDELTSSFNEYGSNGVKRAGGCKVILLDPSLSTDDIEGLIEKVKSNTKVQSSLVSCSEAGDDGSSIIDRDLEKKTVPPNTHALGRESIMEGFIEKTSCPVTLSYKNYIMPEILKKILPEGIAALSGFEQVGHIAHVNLSEAHLPYRFIIGQVILDCNPTVKTVVNKVGIIDSVYREFKMEVIGGDATNLTAEVRQYGCVFMIPYDKVYWNSRLGHEHNRLVSLINPGDQLFDVMAGCGPFVIPAAKKGVTVHANDLNPASVEAMRINIQRNGTTKMSTLYEMDGRDFIDTIVRDFLIAGPISLKGSSKNRRHMTMNLPAIAVEFLDVFTRPSWRKGDIKDKNMLIHVYCFSAATNPLADAVVMCEEQLKCPLTVGGVCFVERVNLVRDVSPQKQMVCVSFRLPNNIFGDTADLESCVKKQRAE